MGHQSQLIQSIFTRRHKIHFRDKWNRITRGLELHAELTGLRSLPNSVHLLFYYYVLAFSVVYLD